MPDVPEFQDCEGCGKTRQNPKVELFHVPSCPEGLEDTTVPCNTTPKFYSNLTRDFVLPAPGQVVKVYVCDGKLFAGCQWLGICNPYDSTGKSAAFLRIISTAKNALTVYNGCSPTNPIVDNPEVGTSFPQGTPIYPAPPRWCSAQFNKYISEAIANSDGQVCTAILGCLADSDQICFSSVPNLISGDGAELSLFGGLIAGAKATCMRFLDKITTGSTGTTLCFPNVPTFTDDPDEDGHPKTLVYFSPVTKCLGSGAPVGQSCVDALNFDPATQKINKIWICAQVGDSVKQRLLVPSAANQSLVSFLDGSVLRWQLGLGRTVFDIQARAVAIGPGANPVTAGASFTFNLGGNAVPAGASELIVFMQVKITTADGIAFTSDINGAHGLDMALTSVPNSQQFVESAQLSVPITNGNVVTVNYTGASSGSALMEIQLAKIGYR